MISFAIGFIACAVLYTFFPALARIKGVELSSGAHRIGIAGSGYRIGDQRNLVSSIKRSTPARG